MARFMEEFAPAIKVQQLEREFQNLRQTTKIVMEITVKFKERALLVPQYVMDEEMKKTSFHDMLHDDIQEFVSLSSWKTSNDMIARVREQENEL